MAIQHGTKREIWRYLKESLCRRDPYLTALVVGMAINLYGQVLVPVLSGQMDPFGDCLRRMKEMPALSLLSVAIGFAFPFCVSLYSSVSTRYKARREHSLALFPDTKPDPVFRAALDGSILEAGASTLALFERFGIDNAVEFLGSDAWGDILERAESNMEGPDVRVHFAPERQSYLVVWAKVDSGLNLYLTRVSDLRVSAHQ